ncbi:hypothetical protein B0T17DRAFT_509243 [Bombardia bombarda]|uniref:Integral membrane protein n=1 Tax=Bombardia bombarda TaxID=252184 RepID=A0AA39WUN5_9PEZI|nr:hypothetical protein B0T17DRAFT_509243 [Bombardia bombarda]
MGGIDPGFLAYYLGLPLQTAPPGVTPNFVNPESIDYQIYITVGLCTPLMIIFSLARLTSNIYLKQKTVMSQESVQGGAFGRHAWNVLSSAFTKQLLVVSVLLLYLQIFRLERWIRIASIIGIVFIVLVHISMSVSYGILCAPTTGLGQLDFLAAYFTSSCRRVNVVTDIFLVILAVSSMFLVGISACISSSIGLVYRVRFYKSVNDTTRIAVPMWATVIAEVAAGVIICCMPSMVVVFRSVKEPMLSWITTTSQRALRLAGCSRSGLSIPQYSNPNSKVHLEGRYLDDGGRDRDAIYCHPGSFYRNDVWVDAELNTHSLEQLNPGSTGIGRKMEVEVSRTTLGRVQRPQTVHHFDRSIA